MILWNLRLIGTVIIVGFFISDSASAENDPFLPLPVTIVPGVDLYTIHLSGNGPAYPMQVDFYLPQGRFDAKSLPLVLIAPAGTANHGSLVGDWSPECIPYAQAGFAVANYQLSGAVPDDVQKSPTFETLSPFIERFKEAGGGILNAEMCLDYILKTVPQVDPDRLYACGHSSAGTIALNLVRADTRIKACCSYAPSTDVEAWWHNPQMDSYVPGYTAFTSDRSPLVHFNEINCPVYFFHADDDSMVPTAKIQSFLDKMMAAHKPITYEHVPTGEHYESMIRQGIPGGIRFLISQGAKPQPPISNPRVNLPPDADGMWAVYQEQRDALETEARLFGDSVSVPEVLDMCNLIQTTLAVFIKRFPDDPRSWEGRMAQEHFIQYASQFSVSILQNIAASNAAPRETIAKAEFELIKPSFLDAVGASPPSPNSWDRTEKIINDFDARYHDTKFAAEIVPEMWNTELKTLVETRDKKRLDQVVENLDKTEQSALHEIAKAAEDRLDFLSRPLDLKFRAADGTAFDLMALRGKVVLIDFWDSDYTSAGEDATNLVALYKKYNSRGLEIVGICFNQDSKASEVFEKKYGMTWSECTTDSINFVKQLGVTSVPQIWLLNQQGIVISTNSQTLDNDIDALLVKNSDK